MLLENSCFLKHYSYPCFERLTILISLYDEDFMIYFIIPFKSDNAPLLSDGIRKCTFRRTTRADHQLGDNRVELTPTVTRESGLLDFLRWRLAWKAF
jgi:hypothetical protein